MTRAFRVLGVSVASVLGGLLSIPSVAMAQQAGSASISCASTAGTRTNCPASTASGVTLIESSGTAPWLLGKAWGYDDNGVWVSDGCSAKFFTAEPGTTAAPETAKDAPEHIPNVGFKLYSGENGQIYVRLMTYVRYLNQSGLESSYTDY